MMAADLAWAPGLPTGHSKYVRIDAFRLSPIVPVWPSLSQLQALYGTSPDIQLELP
jgi:hypothetical protein